MERFRAKVRQDLQQYRRLWVESGLQYDGHDPAEEKATVDRLQDFVEREDLCLERACAEGHITSSALIVNPRRDKVLLTLHAKLNMWIQLGGHVDGEKDIAASALREACEESGRNDIAFLHWERSLIEGGSEHPLPFDCDIHEIPARKNDPAHKHFDLRYLFVLDDKLPLIINEESKDLRWIDLDKASDLTQEASMLRQFAKLRALDGKADTDYSP